MSSSGGASESHSSHVETYFKLLHCCFAEHSTAWPGQSSQKMLCLLPLLLLRDVPLEIKRTVSEVVCGCICTTVHSLYAAPSHQESKHSKGKIKVLH